MARKQAKSSVKSTPSRQGSGGKAASEALQKDVQVSMQKNETRRKDQNQSDKDKQAHIGAPRGRKKH
jgi:hypothetical protein